MRKSLGFLITCLVPAAFGAASMAGDSPPRVSPAFTEANIPAEAKRTTLDPELAEWPKSCPRLGAHEPIEDARRAHYALVPKDPPPIGRVENIAVACDQGTVAVRIYHPSGEEKPRSPALI